MALFFFPSPSHVYSNGVYSCECVPRAGNPVEHFTDGHPLPSSHEPPHSHQPVLQADSKLSLFLLSPLGWTVKASSCCLLSSGWVFTSFIIPRMQLKPGSAQFAQGLSDFGNESLQYQRKTAGGTALSGFSLMQYFQWTYTPVPVSSVF